MKASWRGQPLSRNLEDTYVGVFQVGGKCQNQRHGGGSRSDKHIHEQATEPLPSRRGFLTGRGRRKTLNVMNR